MKKIIKPLIFGAIVGIIIPLISGYSFLDWQWWASVLPIIIAGTY